MGVKQQNPLRNTHLKHKYGWFLVNLAQGDDLPVFAILFELQQQPDHCDQGHHEPDPHENRQEASDQAGRDHPDSALFDRPNLFLNRLKLP